MNEGTMSQSLKQKMLHRMDVRRCELAGVPWAPKRGRKWSKGKKATRALKWSWKKYCKEHTSMSLRQFAKMSKEGSEWMQRKRRSSSRRSPSS